MVIPGIANRPVRAFLLDGGAPLAFAVTNNAVCISVPATAPDKVASVVALDIQGAPQIVKPDPYAEETPTQRDARMGWWRAARFGMFVHWGVYSVPAGMYNGKRIGGIGEWIMNTGKIRWRSIAPSPRSSTRSSSTPTTGCERPGTRHEGHCHHVEAPRRLCHVRLEGFGLEHCQGGAVWPGPVKGARRRLPEYGLKLGFYYSQAQDWNNGGSAAGGK